MDNSTTFDIKRFAQIEKNLSLFEHSYNGFYYWRNIRFIVCASSLYGNRLKNEKKALQQRKRNFLSYYISGFGMMLWLTIQECFRSTPKAELLFLRDTRLSDKFFDYWALPNDITLANYRFFSYEENSGKGEHFIEWPKLKSAIIYKFKEFLHLIKKDKKERIFLYELEKRLIKVFGQSISAKEMEKIIQYNSISDKNYYAAFKKLFAKTGCNAINFKCYYQGCLFAAIKAANEIGITTIEMQHGAISNHQEYWFEDRRGLHNYTPDYLLTFGEAHNTWIKLVEGHKAIAVGYPFQEKMIKAVENIKTNEKEIMIYPVSDPRFEEVLDQFTNEITKLGYSVYLKIHPLEAVNVSVYYPVLSKNKNLQVITSQKEGIYYWLKKAKHHIMTSTTVALEAMVFDHANVCIATHVPHEQAQCLLDWGTARGFSTAEELKELILNPIDLTTENAKKVRERLWRSNASENMKNIFQEFKDHNWRL